MKKIIATAIVAGSMLFSQPLWASSSDSYADSLMRTICLDKSGYDNNLIYLEHLCMLRNEVIRRQNGECPLSAKNYRIAMFRIASLAERFDILYTKDPNAYIHISSLKLTYQRYLKDIISLESLLSSYAATLDQIWPSKINNNVQVWIPYAVPDYQVTITVSRQNMNWIISSLYQSQAHLSETGIREHEYDLYNQALTETFLKDLSSNGLLLRKVETIPSF